MVCNMCPLCKICSDKSEGCETCAFAKAFWKEREKVINLKARNQKLERENTFLKNQLEDLSEVASLVVARILVDKFENILDSIKSDDFVKLVEIRMKELPDV